MHLIIDLKSKQVFLRTSRNYCHFSKNYVRLIGLVFEFYHRPGVKKQRALEYVKNFTRSLKITEARREGGSTTTKTLGLDGLWDVSLWEKIRSSRVQAEVASTFLWLREIMFPTTTEFRMLSQWGRLNPVITKEIKDSEWNGVSFCVCQAVYNEADDNGTLVQCSRCKNWYHDECVGLALSKTLEENTDWHCPICQKQQKAMVLLGAEQAEEVTVGRSMAFGGGGGWGQACDKKTNSEIKKQFLALLEMFSVTLVPLLVSFLGRDDYCKFLRLTTKFVESSAQCKKVRCLTGFCFSLKMLESSLFGV